MITAEQILTPELLNILRNYRECRERCEETGSETEMKALISWAMELASELDCTLEGAA